MPIDYDTFFNIILWNKNPDFMGLTGTEKKYTRNGLFLTYLITDGYCLALDSICNTVLNVYCTVLLFSAGYEVVEAGSLLALGNW